MLAEYTSSWVRYIQDGKNPIMPVGKFTEADMLALRPIACTRLRSKRGVY